MPVIRGRELLCASDDAKVDVLKLQQDHLKYVHHIWLTKAMPCSGNTEVTVPNQFCKNVASWSTGVPGCVQVEWLDVDASVLVSVFDKTWFFYNVLETPVERSDYLRMLILHKFGGIYVDIDMQAFDNVVPHLNPSRPINLLHSPLFTEMFQSCFLVSHEKEHPFWIEVAKRIEHNVTAISGSKPEGLVGRLMSSRLTRHYTRMSMTVFLTGPATLDKCIANAHVNNMHINAFGCLPDCLYRGPVAVHHEEASWTWLPSFLCAKAKVESLFKFDRFSFVGTLTVAWTTWIVVAVMVLSCVREGRVY